MPPLLLTTELGIPLPRRDRVARPRLLARLDNGLHAGHRLILVSAPAGYGKTTLIAHWISDFWDVSPFRDVGRRYWRTFGGHSDCRMETFTLKMRQFGHLRQLCTRK